MTIRQTTYFFVLAVLLLSEDLTGAVLGLPEFITAKRVGVLLLTAILVLQPGRLKPVPIQWTIAVLCFITFWANVSYVLSDHVSLGGWVGNLMAWGLVTYCVFGFATILPRIIAQEKQLFIRAMIGMGFIVNLLTVMWLVKSFGLGVLFSPQSLRHALDDNIVCGMNRYLNGLFFLNMFPIAVFLGIIRVNLPFYVLSMVASVGFSLLCFLSASRQTVAAIILYAIVLVAVRLFFTPRQSSPVRRGSKGRWLRVVVGVGVLAYLVHAILSSEGLRQGLNEWLVAKTQSQYSSESQGRIPVVRNAWKTGLKYPAFGAGDFFLSNENPTEKFTHNGYAGLLANHGFPPLIAIIVLLGLCLAWGFVNRGKAEENLELWCASYSFLIVYLVWAVNFNDILREHMLFFTLTLMITSITKSKLTKTLV